MVLRAWPPNPYWLNAQSPESGYVNRAQQQQHVYEVLMKQRPEWGVLRCQAAAWRIVQKCKKLPS